VALGCEVSNHVGLELAEQPPYEGAVADVALDEAVAPVVRHLVERFEHSGIGQLVEVEHLVRAVPDQVPNQRRPDEPGPSRDEYPHR
jgi:hypothetical protein